MQREFEVSGRGPGIPISILGVNTAGAEAGNALNCAGRVLPWLQDTPDVDAWSAWSVTWRDVVILNARNEKVAVYSLTTHDLADPANYAELRGMLRVAAGASESLPDELAHRR